MMRCRAAVVPKPSRTLAAKQQTEDARHKVLSEALCTRRGIRYGRKWPMHPRHGATRREKVGIGQGRMPNLRLKDGTVVRGATQ